MLGLYSVSCSLIPSHTQSSQGHRMALVPPKMCYTILAEEDRQGRRVGRVGCGLAGLEGLLEGWVGWRAGRVGRQGGATGRVAGWGQGPRGQRGMDFLIWSEQYQKGYQGYFTEHRKCAF